MPLEEAAIPDINPAAADFTSAKEHVATASHSLSFKFFIDYIPFRFYFF
jgi:hypothetical protein